LPLPALLPDHDTLKLQHILVDPDDVTLVVRTCSLTSSCPKCGRPSLSVHSRYTRTLNDLPWQGRPVKLQLQTRRFFCRVSACPRKVFAERIPKLTDAWARSTGRLRDAHRRIGHALGGESGSRLATHLGMPITPDTLLRRVKATGPSTTPTVRILGVDDWAWRKGQRYGTILCDLEAHRPIDLLPERSVESLERWLKEHPEIEVVSRDRGDEYIKGASQGAPQAIQVADRFHLLTNARDAIVRVLERHHAQLRESTRMVVESQKAEAVPASSQVPHPESTELQDRETPLTRSAQRSHDRRARRLERYERVIELHRQKIPLRAIARRLGMNRSTVRRWLAAGSFPERAHRRTVRGTDHFSEPLRRLWDQGCHNAAQLTRELKEQGFRGSYHMVRRRVSAWRATGPRARMTGQEESTFRCPSPRRVSWWLLKDRDELEPEEGFFVETLLGRCSELVRATELAREFGEMVRKRLVEKWDEWIARIEDPATPRELRSFAEGLKKDEKAVRAALSLEWSNGQVEGQINKLKTLKRQMYGRAGFALLRSRLLQAG
jgi:transposase